MFLPDDAPEMKCHQVDHVGSRMDEADTIFVNGGSAELRCVLNAGLYRSNAFVLRCMGDRKEPKACSVWCPKAIALIGRLPTTLEDRSIVIPMRRRGPEEHVDVLHVDRLFAYSSLAESLRLGISISCDPPAIFLRVSANSESRFAI